MKMKWMLLVWALIAMQVRAEESVVIDSEMVGGVSSEVVTQGADTATSVSVSPADTAATSQAEANKERILRGGKMSSRQKREMFRASVSEGNKQQGEDFLAHNKEKPGVVSLPSGVQYKVLRAGKGKTPDDSSVVVCRYRGTLIDGTEFDQSETKRPVPLNVASFLPGLREAVKLMPVGSKWQVVIPPQLAYGEAGNRGVGSNAVLIYEMEIVGIR